MRGINLIMTVVIVGSLIDPVTTFFKEINEPLSPLARAAEREYRERFRQAEEERLERERAADRKAQEERERAEQEKGGR